MNKTTIVPDPEIIRAKLKSLKIVPVAKALGVSRTSLYNFSTDRTKDIPLETFRQLVEYLVKEGHYAPATPNT